ncbi:alkyl sulfatase dimerization domain-containing protein [Microbacterium sp. CFBP9034]|uniref:alkyl sulfatase dimerization domain-containing protein n=1 Tax=Microbacterium sp. CFBP9034 TaxID=3096540 RepID=UPI002A69C293|nr:alkyl sulfatase dimerization domain-containing protein [Microbacterium sp. CFBP9034]MDY0910469.1 alkyl sulfatase dimerization domain-containing protein [Microbacterium sp. CFBP9034]
MTKYWLGADEGIRFTPSGENTAYTDFANTVPPEMTEHSRTMDTGVFEVLGKGVFQIFGYALSAMTVVEGDDGLILIDPPEDVEKGRRQYEVLRTISDKPIRAVIYSHWHTDHNAGVKAFITQEQADSGEVKVIAHRDFMSNIIANSISGDGPIIAVRADYSLGSLLEVGPEGRVNGGLGPDFVMETMSLVTPNTLVDDKLELTIAGVRMEIFWAPSEAIDEIVTWFPDLGVLQSAEVIQGESFPNLHSIRGSRYRDPQAWFTSIDKNLRPLPADFMIPSHGRPVAGRAEVAKVLTDYRDAISYVYDQTLRWMNRGLLPDDLVEKVQLPAELAQSEWLGNFYGGVPHSVRQIYVGELGWFNADPTTLAPLNIRESSRRYVDLIGGRDAVFAEAKKAADAGDHQWAAELVSHLVRIDAADTDARALKASALRILGYGTPNSNWRNFYLTAARELDGTIDYSLAIQIDAPDQIAAMPGSALLESLRFRIDPDKAAGIFTAMAVEVADTGEHVGLIVRNGVLEVTGSSPEDAALTITAPKQLIAPIVLVDARRTLDHGTDSGALTVRGGTVDDAKSFFDLFDRRSEERLHLADR